MATVFNSPAELKSALGKQLGKSEWLEITQAPDVTNVDALECLTNINWDLAFFSNPALQDLDGLANLRHIEFLLRMDGEHPALTSVAGLRGLTEVPNVDIGDYPNLPQCELDALTAAWESNGIEPVGLSVAPGNPDGVCE